MDARRMFGSMGGLGAASIVAIALCGNGCATTGAEAKPAANANASAETAEAPQGGEVVQGVPPEKLDELNEFFYRKMGPIQFRCYNDEVEKTHKKVQGNLSLSLIVQPGGKATDVKVTESSLNSPGIEQCVVDEIKQWEWPDVPSPAPYVGSINFKPAW